MPLHALFLGRKQRHLKNKSTGGFGGHLKLLFGKTKSLLCVKVFEACILLPLPSCLWIRVSQQDTIVYVVISLVRVTLALKNPFLHVSHFFDPNSNVLVPPFLLLLLLLLPHTVSVVQGLRQHLYLSFTPPFLPWFLWSFLKSPILLL